jgi:hypothetical protein
MPTISTVIQRISRQKPQLFKIDTAHCAPHTSLFSAKFVRLFQPTSAPSLLNPSAQSLNPITMSRPVGGGDFGVVALIA